MTPLRLSLPAPVTGRLGAIDELKGVAILMVIAYHALGVLGVENRIHGEVGVDLFVVLSGVGLAYGNRWEGAGRFLARRFWRVGPAYWMVLTAFVLGDAAFLGRRYSTFNLAVHYLGIHAFLGDAYGLSIDDSFWFISLIALLYVLYLPLRRLIDRPDALLALGCSVSAALAIGYFRAGQVVGFDHLSLRIPDFLIGILAGRLLRTGSLEIPLTPLLGLTGVILFYIPYYVGFVYASMAVGGAIMLFYVLGVRGLVGAPVRGALGFVGDRSLELYLIHQPLVRDYNLAVLSRWYRDRPPPPAAVAAGIVAGLAAAFVLACGLHALLRAVVSSRRKPAPAV